MKIFAEIYKSKVWGVHEVPDDFTVVFDPRSFRLAVDVTNEDPIPEEGWDYDVDTETFTKPAISRGQDISAQRKNMKARNLFRKGKTDEALRIIYE